jgi:hypothetical protein
VDSLLCRRNLKERDYLEDLRVDKSVILKWIFKERGVVWAGLIWLRVGTGSGLL